MASPVVAGPSSVGFIGCGAMGGAIALGIAASAASRQHFALGIHLFDVNPKTMAALQGEISAVLRGPAVASPPTVSVASSLEMLFQRSEVIVIAVKPVYAAAALAGVHAFVRPHHVLLSIMGGISISTLRGMTTLAGGTTTTTAGGGGNGSANNNAPVIVRSMPNTPLMVGKGAVAFAVDPAVAAISSSKQRAAELSRRVFEGSGIAVEVPEPLLDAVTGTSGSGPAYFALVIEALADGAVRQGIPRELALKLAAATAVGSGQMILGVPERGIKPIHPALLKDMVTSPGGTTAAGLSVLERRGVRSAVIDAVESATRRGAALGKMAEMGSNSASSSRTKSKL